MGVGVDLSSQASVPVVPGLSDDEQRVFGQLLTQLRGHAAPNAVRTLLYNGDKALSNRSGGFTEQYRQTAKVIGWPRAAVDHLARRTALVGFDVLGADGESLGVQQVWDDNDLAIEQLSATTSALLHGPAFLVCTRGDPRAGEPAALIHVVGAEAGTGEWDPRVRRLTSFLRVSAFDGSDVLAFSLYLPGVIVVAERASTSSRWSVERAASVGVPVERLPFRPRDGRPFGSSRISRPMIALTDAAMRSAARMDGQADVYSIPQMLLLGASAGIFKDGNGLTKSELQVALGRVLGIPDDDRAANPRAQVQVIQAASPDPHLSQLRQYAQLFSGESSIPVEALGVSDMANPTSAEAYIASREDLIAEAETATDVMSVGWARTMARALAIHTKDPVPDPSWQIRALWRAPQHLSRAAQADAGMKQLTAVPWLADTDVGLELLGLTETQIERALAQRGRAQGASMLGELMAAEAAAVDPPADEAPAEEPADAAGSA